MHLFDAEGKIEEFFRLRLEYYERKKKHKLENLERLLLVLDNKARFILGVVSGDIVVSNRKKADLLIERKQKGFIPMPRKGKSAVPQIAFQRMTMTICYQCHLELRQFKVLRNY